MSLDELLIELDNINNDLIKLELYTDNSESDIHIFIDLIEKIISIKKQIFAITGDKKYDSIVNRAKIFGG